MAITILIVLLIAVPIALVVGMSYVLCRTSSWCDAIDGVDSYGKQR